MGIFGIGASALGQWTTQQFTLSPGWNGIYLEVDPAPSDADRLFAGTPFASVWIRSGAAQSEPPTDCTNPNDPACVPRAETGWRTWLPESNLARSTVNLRVIRGGQALLIRSNSAFVWNVTGIPSSKATHWRQGFNWVGFHVVEPPAIAPTFQTYLSSAPVQAGAVIFELSPLGLLVAVASPNTARISAKRAYCVRAERAGEYDGPVDIDRSTLRGVDFVQNIADHDITLKNLSTARTVTAVVSPSSPVPLDPANLPGLAGDVPLRWLNYQAANNDQLLAWSLLSGQNWVLTGGGLAGSSRVVRIAVARTDLAEAFLDETGSGEQYGSIITITDGLGFQRRIPVVAQVIRGGGGQTVASGGALTRPGLYVGRATINAAAWTMAAARRWVNQDPNAPILVPGEGGDSVAPRPTAQPFEFPVLLHVSRTGVIKLLHEATMMWQPVGPPADGIGRFVLVTPECPEAVRQSLEAGAILAGKPFSRRISTAAMHFTDGQDRPIDLLLQGDFATGLRGTSTILANGRLNPFRHSYHPDHDCDESGECTAVTRFFELTFNQAAPTPSSNPSLGESFFQGTYTETISGLNKAPIQIRGALEVTRISEVATLNAAP